MLAHLNVGALTHHSVCSLLSFLNMYFIPHLEFLQWNSGETLQRQEGERKICWESYSRYSLLCKDLIPCGIEWIFFGRRCFFSPSTLAQYLNQRLLTLNWEWAWALPITTDVMSSLPPFFRILPSPKAPLGNIRVRSVARHTCWSCLWGGVKGRNVCDSWGQIALIELVD